MSYFGEQVEERRRFTKEERHAILMRNSCRCCTCNKKLTDKTMTVEHIIPISRGGTNDIKNLIPLCGECNRMKGNLLYIGMDYYAAITNVSLQQEISKLVFDWFESVKSSFDLRKYPLVSPCISINLVMGDIKTKVFSHSSICDLHYVGKSLREEVESVCGISLSDAASYYVLKKRASDKLLLLLKVEYENDVLRFIVLWNDILSLKVLSTILWSIAYHTNGRFKILNIPLDGFCIWFNGSELCSAINKYGIEGVLSEGYTVSTYKYSQPYNSAEYCAVAGVSVIDSVKNQMSNTQEK